MLLMGPGGYEDGGGPDGGGLTAAPEMRVFWDISAEENVILYDIFCED